MILNVKIKDQWHEKEIDDDFHSEIVSLLESNEPDQLNFDNKSGSVEEVEVWSGLGISVGTWTRNDGWKSSGWIE
jgi:hypothetical protein